MAARQRIPSKIDHADAVFNVSAVSFLLAGLVGGRPDAIRLGLRDRLHQPYRAPLIGPVTEAFEEGMKRWWRENAETRAANVHPDPATFGIDLGERFDPAGGLRTGVDAPGGGHPPLGRMGAGRCAAGSAGIVLYTGGGD